MLCLINDFKVNCRSQLQRPTRGQFSGPCHVGVNGSLCLAGTNTQVELLTDKNRRPEGSYLDVKLADPLGSLVLVLISCLDILLDLGAQESSLGQLKQAEGRIQLSMAAAKRVGAKQLLIRGLLARAAIHENRNEQEREMEVLEEALALARETDDGQAIGLALGGLAGLASRSGDIKAGVPLLHEASSVQAEVGDLAGLAASLNSLAVLAGDGRRYVYAARLYGAAQALRRRTGLEVQKGRAPQEGLDSLKRKLGTKKFVTVYQEGYEMSPTEAASYAARGRGPRTQAVSGWESLTEMEVRVVKLVAEGLTSAEIAERLVLSPRTVEDHASKALHKFGFSSRREIVKRAIAGTQGFAPTKLKSP